MKSDTQHVSPGDSQGRAVFAVALKNDNSSHCADHPIGFFYGHDGGQADRLFGSDGINICGHFNLILSHIAWMPFALKQDKTFYPG